MDDFDITVTVDRDGVGVVCFDRPPSNYFTTRLVLRLAECIRDAGRTGARSVVLRTSGRHFCAGLDFDRSSGAPVPNIAALYEAGLQLFRAEVPIVAEIRGAAIGGGLGLALAADFRVGAPKSRFAANFARLGLHHGFGLSVTLPRLVGAQRAAELLYTGRAVTGNEALTIGLCDRLVADDELQAAAYGFAAELAASAPLAVRSIRRTLCSDLLNQLEYAMASERHEQEALMNTQDFEEGTSAVLQRRPAIFSGR